jgi:3-carboxy-cis,cis-muconate cycloisomerase
MAVSAIDSKIFRNLFGTAAVRANFTDEAFVQRMIEVEAALARAQSAAGIIPPEVGAAITESLSATTIEYA